jgi:hypothetical protein
LKRTLAVCLLAVLAQLGAAPAVAGPFGDEMSRCMVRAATTEDKAMLVQWIFAVMALHPNVRQLSTVTDETRANLNKRMADLVVALLSDRCAKESREAMKNEGIETLQSSFGVLGQVAMKDLFVDPGVNAGIAEFSKNLDEKKLKGLLEDAK